jgi:hypothetical protein
MPHSVGRTVIVHKDDFAYNSHPSIAVLDNGEWLAVFGSSRRREPKEHPPGDPLFRNLLMRTADRGETWSAPTFVPDFDWYGVECPGIAQLADGTVVLSQFRFGWYPLGAARQRRAAGEAIYLSLPDQPFGGWTEDFTDADWERSQRTWARGYHGLYAHLSRDRGATFETVKIDCAPYRDGYTRVGVVELADGRIAYAVTEHHPPLPKGDTFLVTSANGGRDWDPPVLMVPAPDDVYGEPDVAEVAEGEIYCILRADARGGYLEGCRSVDGGATWSAPEVTPMYGGPGHLLNLHDGRLLCTYGRRKAPFGVRACLSDDGGRTWDLEREIVIRADLPNGDLGYPTTIEYAPGELFCCYYGQEPDGVTCIQGTYVTLA